MAVNSGRPISSLTRWRRAGVIVGGFVLIYVLGEGARTSYRGFSNMRGILGPGFSGVNYVAMAAQGDPRKAIEGDSGMARAVQAYYDWWYQLGQRLALRVWRPELYQKVMSSPAGT
jgi:hypothetical protein